jgi:hypothetical protein
LISEDGWSTLFGLGLAAALIARDAFRARLDRAAAAAPVKRSV